jgi:DNA-binding NarL/FixJ family response regulator
LAQDAQLRQTAHQDLQTVLVREQAALDEEIAALRKQRKKLWDEYRFWSAEWREGRSRRDEYDVHLADFREAKEEVESRLTGLEQERAAEGTRRAVLERARRIVADFGASWDGLSMAQRREVVQSVVESASMGRLPDGRTEVVFTLRGFPPVTRYIERRWRADRPDTGPDSLTPREQAFLYRYSQGLDRAAIAKTAGVTWRVVNALLWKARKKLGAESLEQAWQVAGEHIEGNLVWLPLTGRKRRPNVCSTPGPLLTDAQTRLLSSLSDGLTPKAAADKLGISVSTAYVQVKNCRDRLGVATTEEAVRKAKDLGYVGAG